MKLAADELFTAGVNAIVYHGFPYIVPQVPPPGWHPFIGMFGDGNYSSQLNELNPIWPYLAQLNSYMTRVQFISQTGSNVAALALYRNDLVHGAGDNPPTPKLNQAIMDAGYNYDHINADSLLHCDVRDRMLVAPGGARYRALVFPPLDSISAPLAEKLQGFAAAGLPIFFSGQTPLEADGFLDRDLETNRVNTAMHVIHNAHSTYFSTNIANLVTMLQKAVHPNIRFHSQALHSFRSGSDVWTLSFCATTQTSRSISTSNSKPKANPSCGIRGPEKLHRSPPANETVDGSGFISICSRSPRP